MTARWGEPVRRAAAPVMVTAPSVSTDDVTRLLERREARPVADVAESSSESPVATLLARRAARAAELAAPATAPGDGPDSASPSLDALLSRRDNRTRPPAAPEETP